MRLRPYVRAGNAALGWVVALLLVLVFYTNMPLVANVRTGATVAPLAYAALLVLALFVAAAKPIAALRFARSPFALWTVATLALYSITLARVHSGQDAGTWATNEDLRVAVNRIQLFLLCPAFAFLAWRTPPETFRSFLAALAFVAPALVLLDFFEPGLLNSLDENRQVTSGKTRVGGPWDNPNAGGEALVLALLLSRDALSRRMMAIAFTLAGMALIITGSRSGMGAYLVIGVWFMWRGTLPRWYVLVPIAFVLSFATTVRLIEDVAESAGRERGINDVIYRLSIFGQAEEVDDDSADTRAEVVRDSLARILEAPFVGHGLDYVDPLTEQSTHNLPLAMTYTHGLPGLALWLALAWLLARDPATGKLRPNPAVLVFAWYSLFSHNMLENNHWLVFVAIWLFARRRDLPLLSAPSGWQTARSRKRRRSRSPVRASWG